MNSKSSTSFFSSMLMLAVTMVALPAWSETEELKVDSFVSGQPVSFQAGFFPGEMGAVRLEPTIACPCKVDHITLVYGGGTGTNTLGVYIWDDLGVASPGTELFNGTANLTGSNDSLQQITLPVGVDAVLVDGPFRVGIEIQNLSPGGLPSLATDFGGINASKNFLYAFSLIQLDYYWDYSGTFGLTGDWIIRATISTADAVPVPVPATDPTGLGMLLAGLFAAGCFFAARASRAGGAGQRCSRAS
jgi:hypothetical protein